MLVVKIDNKFPLERALKVLKSKVIKTKQNEILKERKEFVKKSVKTRQMKQLAIYRQRLKENR